MNDAVPQLLQNEQVKWDGQPYSGLLLRPIDVALIPFSLFWAGFAVFWNWGVWNSEAPISFRLFGLPFLIIGFYVVFGRFFADIFLRRKTRYFVTNRRILLTKSVGRSVKSLDIKRLPGLELDERSDGSGTIRFGAAGGWLTGGQFGIWQPSLDPVLQFTRIPNVRSVYEIIQKQSDA